MSTFGELLHDHRMACRDPLNRKQLSQVRLGELLGHELGLKVGYSGAAVSDWENDKSQIHKDDRHVLISLLKVLHKNGGLKDLSEAKALLEAGNYRALDEDEKTQVFPKDLLERMVKSSISEPAQTVIQAEPVGRGIFSTLDFRRLAHEEKEPASPVWPRVVAGLMRRAGQQVEPLNPLRVIATVVIWIFAFLMLSPMLDLPHATRSDLVKAVIIYVCASLTLPLFIGLMTNTKDNLIWQKRDKAPGKAVRLYTHEGAFLGFHMGYIVIFFFNLILHYLEVHPPAMVDFVLAGLPVLMGAVGAHMVPDNLWRAYDELLIKKNWVIIVGLPLVGTFLGWFFLEFYSELLHPAFGTTDILIALFIIAWKSVRDRKKASSHE
jgi:hypothetical protein